MSDKWSDQIQKRSAARRQPMPDAPQKASHERATHPILRLQRQVGNAVVARMLAQRLIDTSAVTVQRQESEGAEDEEEEMVQTLRLQRQESEGAEDEEEEMVQTLRLQRQESEGGEDEEEEMVQTLRLQRTSGQSETEEPVIGMEGGEVGAGATSKISSMRGGGSPIPEETRAGFEQSLGTSFEDVRVHTGGDVDKLNQSFSARAFTTGNDIFLGSGTYQPATSEGQRVLGHELTHVVQQRSMSGGGPMQVGAADDSYEQEADAAAAKLASGEAAGSSSAMREIDD